jgi:hypothetical protein
MVKSGILFYVFYQLKGNMLLPYPFQSFLCHSAAFLFGYY